MKALIIVASLSVSFSCASWTFQDKDLNVGHITKKVNRVEIKDSSSAAWRDAVPPASLSPGSEVRTDIKSFAMITFTDASKIAVREGSTLKVLGDAILGKFLNSGVYLQSGRLSFSIKTHEPEKIRLSSPLSLALVQTAEGGISFDPGKGELVLSVTSGSVEFSGTQTDCKFVIKAGHRAVINRVGCRCY